MGRKPLAREKRERIRELSQQGLTYQEIADRVGVSTRTAWKHSNKHIATIDFKLVNDVFKKIIQEVPKTSRERIQNDQQVIKLAKKLRKAGL